MKKAVFLTPLKICLQIVLLLAISCFNLGTNIDAVHASTPKSTDSCGQLLADAEAKFLSLLPADGSIPATAEVEAAAAEYIHVSKLCYNEIQANNPSASLQTETPSYIDNGGMILGKNGASANFQTTGGKWNSSTVTFSFMGSGISFSDEGYGTSVAISKLNGFTPCFYTRIINAFAAWQAVSNIHFVRVSDSGVAFNASGATADIRIGAHAFDGPYGILAHAYFPPPNGASAAGDLHFDSAENWACSNTSGGIDIGIVALHEIGHSLGLDHQYAPPTAIMNPTYNPSLTSLQPDDINGIRSIYGAAALTTPSNDSISNATPIPGISYTDIENIDGATIDTTGPIPDPDNIGPCTDTSQHFNKINNSVWYTYTPSTTESIAVDTQGSTNSVNGDLDTFLAIWTLSGSTLNLVICNDDDYTGNTSKLSFLASPGVTYYFETGHYNCYYNTPCTTDSGGNLVFNVNITNTDVYIDANKQDSYYVYNTPTTVDSYPSVQSGPVQVINVTGVNIFSSERVNNGNGFVNELMGLPNNQLTNEYWFPWYDNVSMASWILVGNPSTSTDAHVHIYIAGVEQTGSPFTVPHGSRITPRFTGVQNGPVHVKSDINVFTSERVHTTTQGFVNELMGFSNSKLTNEYWFPWYDNKSMASWILVGNPSTTTNAHVHIYIGGVEQPNSPFTIGPGGKVTPRFTGVANGPVHIKSDINVFTSERVHNANGFINEVMGTANNQLTTEYWYPWYDNVGMASWVLVGNPSTTTNAHVHVYIAGVEQTGSPYTIGPGSKVTPRYTGVVNGPVHVVSDINVFTSERVHTTVQGFVNEMMGMPNSQLNTQYWFTWYDNKSMQSWVLIGRP